LFFILPLMIFHSVLPNNLIPGAAILLISVLNHVHISAGSSSFWTLYLICHLVTKKLQSKHSKNRAPLSQEMHFFTIMCITVLSVMNVACEISRSFQPMFSCHRRLVFHRYRRPTIVYMNEDSAGEGTFIKYLGILSSSSAYYVWKL